MTELQTITIEAQLEALCETIANDPEIRAAREQAEQFLADEQAVALYRDLMTLGSDLQSRHRSGQEVADADIEKFESLRSRADQHDGIQSFQKAQDTLQNIANMVNGFVTKTLEKGRVPTQEEVSGSGGCGAGCGCH